MSDRPGTFLGLKRSELPRFGKVALAFALTQVTSLMGYLAATTLFLKACGAQYLPWAFLSGYLMALVVSATLRRLRDTPPFTLLAVAFTAFAVFQGLASLAGTEGGFGLRWLILTGVVPFPVLCWMLFWNTLQARLLLREVKLWTPLIMAIATLGQVCTGLITGPLGKAIGVQNLLLVSGISLLLSIAVLRWALTGGAGEAPPAPEEPTPAEDVSDPLVTRVAGLVFMGALIKYIVDLQLNAAASARYGSLAEVAGFLGRFDSLTKGTIFVVQSAFTGLLLSRMPPGRLMATMPLLLGAAAVAVVCGAGFPAILAGNFLFTLFDKGTNRTCISLLLAPFPPGRARQARLKLDGQAMGAGVIAVSVAMIAYPRLLDPVVAFGTLLVVCVVYRFWCSSIDNHYIAALRANLQKGAGEARAEALGRLRAFSGQRRLEVLEEMLASPDRDRRRLAAMETARLTEPAAADLMRRALEREQDARVQAVMVSALPRMHAGAEAVEPLLASPDARVRANALEALAQLSGPIALGLAEKHLDSAEARPRASAAVAVALNARDRAHMHRALSALHAMLDAPGATDRAAACWALGRIGHPALVRAIASRLGDAETSVRRQAAVALERVWSPAALPALQAAVTDPANAEFSAVLTRAIDRIEDRTRHEVLAALGTLKREERESLAVHLADLGRDEVALLARALRVDDPAHRLRLGQAIREARSPATRAALERAIAPTPAGTLELTLAPVIEAARAPDAPPELWSILERLAAPAHRPQLAGACHDAVRALAAAISLLPDDRPLPALDVLIIGRLLGLAAGDAAVGTTMLQALASRDPRALSLSAELIEKVLAHAALKRDLVELIEATGDRAALKRAAAAIRSR